MLTLALLVTSIALADSINPSTVVPALWVASAPRARGLTSYTLGVFVVYLAGGLVLVFGPGPALIAAMHHVQGPIEHTLQAAGGGVALAFAYVLWRSRHVEQAQRTPRRSYTRWSAFALGAGIMAIELPTAFMYFGAISAILTSHAAAPLEVSLLLAYNALFVAPLVAIFAIRRLAGERAEQWLISGEGWLRRFGHLALTGAAGTAGAVLVAVGVTGLVGP
jgi:cytochrome c biogenesis protein CcdA